MLWVWILHLNLFLDELRLHEFQLRGEIHFAMGQPEMGTWEQKTIRMIAKLNPSYQYREIWRMFATAWISKIHLESFNGSNGYLRSSRSPDLAGWRAALPDGLGSWIVVPKPSWNAGVRWEQIDLLKRCQLIHDVFFVSVTWCNFWRTHLNMISPMISMISAWFQHDFRMISEWCSMVAVNHCESWKKCPLADAAVNNAPRYGMSEKVTPQPLPAQERHDCPGRGWKGLMLSTQFCKH